MAKFIKSADLVDQYFYDNRNQFCFVGRSNAGKSSLINTLANAALAKTSASPGKTKLAHTLWRVSSLSHSNDRLLGQGQKTAVVPADDITLMTYNFLGMSNKKYILNPFKFLSYSST